MPGLPSPFLGNTWPILKCPAEYRYESNNGPITSNYECQYMQSSYGINFSFSYYDTTWPRRAFGIKPDFVELHEAPMVMDCEAWNVGWNAAAFGWHVDDQFLWYQPYYPFRHPGLTANIVYMDGHVDRGKSFDLGQGPRLYVNLYSTCPCGTPFLGTGGCP